jgi:adenylate cyclase
METDVVSAGMLITCQNGLRNPEATRSAARMTLARAEALLAQDRGAGVAIGFGATALAALGETERARDWIRRALLIDPDNLLMRYNLACALSGYLQESEAALDLLGPYFAQVTVINDVPHPKIDPDLEALRDDPRFLAMIAAAEARLAAEGSGGTAEP